MTTEGTPASKEPGKQPTTASTDPAAAVGVKAGGIQHADSEGPAAVVSSVTGTVEVRRVGEAQYTAAKADTKLYPGDTVRTQESATAKVTLSDSSVVELAEVTTLAIPGRDGTADPASAAAVLGGLARFTVAQRAPGEGPFRVYTASGMIVTKGTVYGVGVAANGQARVGVESGTVEVVGLSHFDAAPVAVTQNTQLDLAADGSVGSTAAWPADDWGTWRDAMDAKIEVNAAVDAHAKAMADLNQQLIDGYADLQTNANNAATFEATAAASADKGDTAAYQAALPEGEATIDASFALDARLEALTWAYASHAELATDLYVRHPKDVEASWQVAAPRVDAAVLWPKRYEVTANAYFEPLRMQYYVHHPVGRMHAELVGVTVPAFYAKVQPVAIDLPSVRAKVKGGIWVAPEIAYHASTRPVWITAPDASWHASVTAPPAAFRAKAGWYVRPPELKAKAMVGTQVTGNWSSKLVMAPAQPFADLRASWTVPVGTKIHVEAPDMHAAANARAHWQGGVNAGGGAAGNVHGQAGAHVQAPDVKVVVPEVKVPDVKATVGVNVRDHRDVAVNAAADASAKAKGAVKATATVKAPEVKIPSPSIKVEGHAKASGGFKIGK